MAISSVNQMVKDRLPFLDSAGFDPIISRTYIQMTYLMQSQTLKTDIEVELEASYRAVENILFSAMVCYQLIKSKAIKTMAGDATSSGGAKILKRAKADVVEAEFIISKASDGSLIQIETAQYLSSLLTEICSLANSLNYSCVWCNLPLDVIPPFIIGEDYPLPENNISVDILSGQPIGS